MTGLEWVLAVVGLTVTALVVVGMILLTPRGMVELDDGESRNGQGAELSRTEPRERTAARP